MNITKLMEVMHVQSQHVSKNKLSSAARSLPTTLSDWLKQCSRISVTSATLNKTPNILHKFKLQTAMNEKTYENIKDRTQVEDDSDFNWFPECINNDK
jgi:hypothetical protein